MKLPITVTINDRAYERTVEPRLLLVHFLRDVAGLTGTKIGCDTSQCGACTVLLDGVAVKSCTCLAVQADGADGHHDRGAGQGRRARTRAGRLLDEARAAMRVLHARHGADGRELLRANPNPTVEQIRHGLEGNMCRCTGYQNIVRADSTRRRGRSVDERHERAATHLWIRHQAPRRSAPADRHRQLYRGHDAAGDGATPSFCAARTRHARITHDRHEPREKRARGRRGLHRCRTRPRGCNPIPCCLAAAQQRSEDAAVPAIAKDVVRYVGDAVAVVVAEIAVSGARRARADRGRLRLRCPPSWIRRRPRKTGAPQLHQDMPNNIAFHWTVAGGDIEAAFAQRRGGRQAADRPAAAHSHGDGTARRARPLRAGHRRADALEHDAEPAHRALHHVARRPAFPRTSCA